LQKFKEGEGIESAFRNNRASFHNNCRLKYSNSRLDRLLKRKPMKVLPLEEKEEESCSKCTRSAVNSSHVMKEVRCILCDELTTADKVHNVQTLELDAKLREYALIVKDMKLLAKLGTADAIAIEAKYHKKCLVRLYTEVRSVRRREYRNAGALNQDQIKSAVFAELVSFINERKEDDESDSPVFRLKDLCDLYSTRLQALGVVDYKVNATQFKDKICKYVPQLEAYPQGRNVLLAFKKDIGQALADACKYNTDEDALCLARAA